MGQLRKNTSRQLLAAAVVSGLIYALIFTIPFLLPVLYATIPPVDYAKLTGHSIWGFLRYGAGIGLLFWLYVWAIRLTLPAADAPSQPHNQWLVFGSSAAFAAVLIFSYPITAIDIFIYAIQTRGWVLYGLSPLASRLNTFPATDPWLGLVAEWGEVASRYGTVWELLSLAGYYLVGGNYLGHLFALKILSAITYLATAALVYQTLKLLHPNYALAGTIAFAWNPLVLFESVQNAHNDVVMVFFFSAAIWAFVQQTQKSPQQKLGWQGLVCLFLALSILTKFVTIIVAPFFLVAMAWSRPTWPWRMAMLAGYGLAVLLPVGLAMLPLWPGLENWAVLDIGSQAGRSLLALLVLGLRDWLGVNRAFDGSRNLILGIYALIYGYNLWQILKPAAPPSTPQRPIALAFMALFWYVLLAAPVFHAWYLLWFLPLAALLLPQARPLTAAIIFSITALLVIPYFETIRVWFPILLQNHFLGHLLGVSLLIIPPALALLGAIRPATLFGVSSAALLED